MGAIIINEEDTQPVIRLSLSLQGVLLLAVLALAALVPLMVNAAPAENHASITMTATPEHPVATQETQLTVVLRDKAQQPIDDAPVVINAQMATGGMAGMPGMQHGGAGLTATARPSGTPGEYLATMKFTDPGDWTLIVSSKDSSAQFKIVAVKNQPNAVPAQIASDSPGTAPSAHGHEDASSESTGPDYYFVGSILGVVLITIAMVPILRRRDSGMSHGEAA
jgi:hypothetical protein